MPVDSSANNFHVKVSIIIPVYNRCLLIRKTIESVLAQTFSNWELIIVDDGSTDNTVDCINSIQDPRVHILSFPHCGNIAELRNTGAQNSSGDLIAFLDSDDLWLPQKLEIQLEEMRKNNAHWCYAGFELIDETGRSIPAKYGSYHPYSGWIIEKLLTYDATANISSLILERSLFDKTGGFNSDPKLFCREDYEFILRLAMNAEACAIDSALVRIRDHEGRTTNTLTNGPEYTANVYEHFYNSCNNKNLKMLIQKQYARHLAEAAEKNLFQKKYSRALKYFTKAIIKGDDPAHLLLSFKRGLAGH
ncbi:MAG TPA: glycosyltransferase family A protein [Puia sp.]|jgi:glycosyltransferase involved in cell wall biosynthesis|nr:glycosyltransferase family A protein [Puia sp.]